MDDIKAIRDALAAELLTRGEWVACGPSYGAPRPVMLNEVVCPDDADGGDTVALAPAGGFDCSADMAFIAACHPERIARLLDALELAQTECKQMRAFLSGVHPDLPGQFDKARLKFAAMSAAPQSPAAAQSTP